MISLFSLEEASVTLYSLTATISCVRLLQYLETVACPPSSIWSINLYYLRKNEAWSMRHYRSRDLSNICKAVFSQVNLMKSMTAKHFWHLLGWENTPSEISTVYYDISASSLSFDVMTSRLTLIILMLNFWSRCLHESLVAFSGYKVVLLNVRNSWWKCRVAKGMDKSVISRFWTANIINI